MADRDPPPFDPRRLVKRALDAAKRDPPADLDGVFDRMDRDDAADDLSAPSGGAFGLGSDDSGLGSSRLGAVGSDATTDSSDLQPSGTVREQDFVVDSTIELPPASSGEPEQPNLSGAAPSSQRRSTSKLTLLATPRYRPTRRPPMAVLRVYDDGQRDFEAVRIRQTPFVIGRQDGDYVVGHERQMSRRHARIDRVEEGEAWRWYLTDLRSTNGTFVRIPKAPLDDGVEVLLGGELVRFSQSPGGAAELVRVAPHAEEERVILKPGVHFIGSDAASCLPFIAGSQFLDPQHLRLEQLDGRWNIVDLDSTNHLWVAIGKRTELTDGSEFQIGEQRFGFSLP